MQNRYDEEDMQDHLRERNTRPRAYGRDGDEGAEEQPFDRHSERFNPGQPRSWSTAPWRGDQGYASPAGQNGPRREHASGLVSPNVGRYDYLGQVGHSGRYYRLPHGSGHAGKGPKGYVRSDERIREDVCDRLCDDAEVDASEMTVVVKSGEVLLEGFVADRRSKHRAEGIAESVNGVREVVNHLRVLRGGAQDISP